MHMGGLIIQAKCLPRSLLDALRRPPYHNTEDIASQNRFFGENLPVDAIQVSPSFTFVIYVLFRENRARAK